jgi:hypothetical protein
MMNLPDPLVPEEIDLKNFPYTPIYRARLFGSSFHARVTDSEWRAGVTLWLKSWEQVPAGSLPDEDIDLCRLAELGRNLKIWKKLREGALRGWIKCSDGRLYHPVVAEVVLDAVETKNKAKNRGKAGAAARWKDANNEKNNAKEDAQAMLKHSSSNAQAMQKQCLEMPIEGNRIELKGIEDISTSLRSVDNDSNSEKQNSKDKKSTIRKNRIVQNQVDGLELYSPTFQQGSDSSGETSLSGGRVAGHGEISAYALKKQKQITRATTLADDWVMPLEWLEDAKNKRLELSLPAIDLRLEAEKFKNWGVQNSKKNWHATWINWILPRETIGKHPQAKNITPFAGAPPSPTEQRIRTADRVREMVLQKFEQDRQRDEQGIDRLDYAGNHRGNAGYLPAFEDSAIGNRGGKRAENSDISEVYLPSDSGNNDRSKFDP